MLPTRISGESQIHIGDDVYLGSNSWLQVIEPDASRTSPVIRLEDGVAISGYCTITAHKSVIIERKVLIARYVYISDHAHAHQSRDIAIMDQGIAAVAPVRIKEGAWLGQGVVVCPGVIIGKNSIIGANSVVRSDIPDYSVAVGAPAKVIRLIDHTASV